MIGTKEYKISDGCDSSIMDIKNDIIIETFNEDTQLRYIIKSLDVDVKFDLEIRLNLPISEIQRVAPDIIRIINSGEIEIYDGMRTSDITGAPIEIAYMEDNVIRIIFSDENYLFPTDIGCNSHYINQYN